MKNIFVILSVIISGFSVKAQQLAVASINHHPKFFVTADLKYSYRLGGGGNYFSPEQEEYTDKLNSGINYDVSAYYYFFKDLALGLKYSVHSATGELRNSYVDFPHGYSRISKLFTNDIMISFYGLGFIYEIPTSNKWINCYVEAGMGYVDYRNDAEIDSELRYKYTAGTFGAYAGVSYQYEVVDNFSVGPKLNIVYASLSGVDYTDPYGNKKFITVEDRNFRYLTNINIGLTAGYKF